MNLTMEELQDFEKDIIQWYLDNYPEIAENLSAQFSLAKLKQREFTSGAGSFLWLQMPKETKPTEYSPSSSQLDGPMIQSSELEHGASVGLGFVGAGIIDYIEIWCHGGDYPHNRHPSDWQLGHQSVNYVDLR